MRLVFLAIVSIAVGAAGFYLVDRVLLPALGGVDDASSRPAENGQASADRAVVALGRLEPANGVVSVSAVPGERIARLDVAAGDVVEEEGASLGMLASHELRQVELEGLRAQLAAAVEGQQASLHVAEARVAQAKAALEQATGNVEQAELQEQEIALVRQRADLARSDYDQLASLASDDAELVTSKQLQRQRLAWQSAQSEFAQAERSLVVNRKAADLAVEAAKADVLAAEANHEEKKSAKSIEALEKQIEAAALQERWARLPAPTTGVVLKTFLRPGEFVTETVGAGRVYVMVIRMKSTVAVWAVVPFLATSRRTPKSELLTWAGVQVRPQVSLTPP